MTAIAIAAVGKIDGKANRWTSTGYAKRIPAELKVWAASPDPRLAANAQRALAGPVMVEPPRKGRASKAKAKTKAAPKGKKR
jgi:hypothetical protein